MSTNNSHDRSNPESTPETEPIVHTLHPAAPIEHEPDRPRRRHYYLGALAALLAALLAFLAIALKPAPTPPEPPIQIKTADAAPHRPADHVAPPVGELTPEQLAQLPESTTYSDIPAAPLDPGSADPSTILRPTRTIAVFDAPHGTPIATLPATQIGSSPTAVPVVQQWGTWLRVLLPSRPNSSTGWVSGERDVELNPVRHLVVINRARHTLTVRTAPQGRWNSRDLGTWRVDVGNAASPTPPGRTFVLAQLQGGPHSPTPYSALVWPLGTHSQTHLTYGGGPGTVAIHGWHNETPRGLDTTDGCIRIPAKARAVLEDLDLGTPVLIT
ncbi:hypothetical protein GCM10022247_35070 [Allokutzneria multivorans]|uniref:L,D-TPase catalytic domain-containing protein n=1 Tax=Allokutzneria multivorans TaxID=1142134 RepID=A0ABP7SD18_9PSEU